MEVHITLWIVISPKFLKLSQIFYVESSLATKRGLLINKNIWLTCSSKDQY